MHAPTPSFAPSTLASEVTIRGSSYQLHMDVVQIEPWSGTVSPSPHPVQKLHLWSPPCRAHVDADEVVTEQLAHGIHRCRRSARPPAPRPAPTAPPGCLNWSFRRGCCPCRRGRNKQNRRQRRQLPQKLRRAGYADAESPSWPMGLSVSHPVVTDTSRFSLWSQNISR